MGFGWLGDGVWDVEQIMVCRISRLVDRVRGNTAGFRGWVDGDHQSSPRVLRISEVDGGTGSWGGLSF